MASISASTTIGKWDILSKTAPGLELLALKQLQEQHSNIIAFANKFFPLEKSDLTSGFEKIRHKIFLSLNELVEDKLKKIIKKDKNLLLIALQCLHLELEYIKRAQKEVQSDLAFQESIETLNNELGVDKTTLNTISTHMLFNPQTIEGLAFLFKYIIYVNGIPIVIPTDSGEIFKFLNCRNEEVRKYARLAIAGIENKKCRQKNSEDLSFLIPLEEQFNNHISTDAAQETALAVSPLLSAFTSLRKLQVIYSNQLSKKSFADFVKQRFLLITSTQLPISNNEIYKPFYLQGLRSFRNSPFQASFKALVNLSTYTERLGQLVSHSAITFSHLSSSSSSTIAPVSSSKKTKKKKPLKTNKDQSTTTPISVVQTPKMEVKASLLYLKKESKAREVSPPSLTSTTNPATIHLRQHLETKKEEKKTVTSLSSSISHRTPITPTHEPTDHWIHHTTRVTYAERVLRWFRRRGAFPDYAEASPDHMKTMRAYHGFSLLVDRLLLAEPDYSYNQRRVINGSIRHCKHMIAKLDFDNKTSVTGVITYTFNETNTCFHRCFSLRSTSSLLNEKMETFFANIEIPEAFSSTAPVEFSDEELEISSTDTGKKDILLDFVQIRDSRHEMTINLIKIPKR